MGFTDKKIYVSEASETLFTCLQQQQEFLDKWAAMDNEELITGLQSAKELFEASQAQAE